MTIEYLKGPASNVGQRFGAVVERQPLVYAPSSTAEVNTALLPPPGSMQQMELAFREEFFDEATLEDVTSRSLSQILVSTLLASLALGAGGLFLRPEWVPTIAGYVSLLLAVSAIMKKQALTAKRVMLYLLVPGVALFLVLFAGQLLQHRLIASAIAALGALLVLHRYGSGPFRFYRDWLYTHPRLKPAERKEPERIALRPSLEVLALLLAIAVIVPEFSTTLALLAVLGISIAVVREQPGRVFRRMREVIGRYLTYGLCSTGAPGVWVPSTTAGRRNWLTVWLFFWPTMALTVSLQLFGPWDLLEGSMHEHFGPEALAHAERSTHGWLLLAGEGILSGEAAYLWLLPVAIACALATSFYALAAVFHKPLVQAEELRARLASTFGADDRPEAEWYWDRIRTSQHTATNPFGQEVREAEHLFVGLEPNAQFPILLSKEVFQGHVYMVGQTGGGKTSLGIMSILMQLMRGNCDKVGDTTPPPPIVILDLKGDASLFESMKAEAAERRRAEELPEDSPRYAFKYFTPEAGRASFYFNPFQSLAGSGRSDMQLCDLVLECLSLFHGDGYGRSYYSRKNRMLLYEAMTSRDLGAKPNSFEDLYPRLRKLSEREEFTRDTFELIAAVHAICRYEKIATAGGPEDSSQVINMHDVLEHRQVIYFWLPAAVESISVREIAKLAFFSCLTAAIDRTRSERPNRDCFLVIDEFQRIAGENFKVVLEQAREYGLTAILANQTLADLKLHDVDLRPTIRTNTRVKMYFGATDADDIQEMVRMSGEELAYVRAESASLNITHSIKSGRVMSSAEAISLTQALKPRFTVNDVLAVNDHPLEFFLHVSRGAGYTQYAGLPHRVRGSFPLQLEIYIERKKGGPPIEATPAEAPVNEKGPKDYDEEAAALLEEKLAEFVRSQNS